MRAAVTLVLALAGTAAADSSGDLLKQGLQQYKAGQYASAVVTIRKAYAQDPKVETLFTLAQAERLSGDCGAAVAHYRQVIEKIGDLNTAKLVQQNIALCEPETDDERDKPADPDETSSAKVPPGPPATVVRTVDRGDTVASSLYAAGGLALGLAGGMYLAARDSRDAAERAGSLAAHDELGDRTRAQFTIAGIAAGAGVALIAGGVLRTMTRKPAAEVAISPVRGGSVVVFATRF